MLDVDIFRERVSALWGSQKAMAAPKRWKSGKRAGVIRKEAQPIQFTKQELERWLWARIGLNAIPCPYPYCRTPIDILSLTLDHVIPRSAGGEFRLENMQIICKECNERKGNMSHDGFEFLLRFANSELSPYDRDILMARLKAAHHGSAQRFFRKPAVKPPLPTKPAITPGLDFSGLGEF